MDLTEISFPVGRNGGNLPLDVFNVVTRLNTVPPGKGGPESPLDVTALVSDPDALGNAIKRFQTKQGLPSRDGRIDPGGATWQRLKKVSGPIPGVPTPSDSRTLEALPALPPSWTFDRPDKNFDMLADPAAVTRDWILPFGGSPGRECDMRLYRIPKKNQFVGVAYPRGVGTLKAIMIYFHHPMHPQNPEYASDPFGYVSFGIGDYMVGRMKVIKQLARSRRDVAVVVPSPSATGVGVFQSDEKLVSAALREIVEDLTGTASDLPLILAHYSGGFDFLFKFVEACPQLTKRVRAVYDFDGRHHVNCPNSKFTALAANGAQVIQYSGEDVVAMGKRTREEALGINAAKNPALINLPYARWEKNSAWPGARHPFQRSWVHEMVPTCMLLHALVTTRFLG
ncbi:peptidoglycan-binding protein [Reyranella sp. CPCC 100927]|uniref:peptidoglycan-binding domain-containing protein n=1 Tax=Reyranella sp. CPCC 100927 TaxID=2599616 RepID=UPI0011B7F0B2|nr:hypothetical protein [Reyranella sp. CPCC 100927]TWT15449.1 hypothetical protein FQU96_03580 [Reyranella sp. CPCC 100927]